MRLNKSNRDEILKAVLDKTINIEVKTISDTLNQAVIDEFKAQLPEGFGKVAKKYPEWFRNIGSFVVARSYLKDSIKCITSNTLKAPHSLCQYYQWEINEVEISDNLKQVIYCWDTMVEHKKKVSNELKKVLSSVTTFKRLQEVWPEVDIYYKPAVVAPVTALVANNDTLNSMLKGV